MNSTYTTEHTSFSFEGGGPPSPGPAQRFDIKRILRQAAPVIIVVSLLLGVPSVTAVWLLSPIEYEVSAELRFKSLAPSVMQEGQSNFSSSRYEQFLSTQIDLIAGAPILRRVLDLPEIANLPEIKRQLDPLAFLKGRIYVRPKRRDSELVTVSMRLGDRETAEKVVNAVITEYMNYTADLEREDEERRLNALTKEKDRLESRIVQSSRRINELQKQIRVPITDNKLGLIDTTPYHTQYAEAMADLSTAQSGVERIQQHIEELEGYKRRHLEAPSQPIYELEVESRVASDPRVSQLKGQHIAAVGELTRLKGTYREGSERLAAAEDNVKNLASQLARTEGQVRSEVLDAMLAGLRRDLGLQTRSVAEAEKRMEQAKAFIDGQEALALEASGLVLQLAEERTNADEDRRNLSRIRALIDTIYMERNAPARVSIASQAIVPAKPDNGRKYQLLLLAVVGSVCTGFAAGLWRELTNQQARSVQDLAAVTPLPVLATIPDAKLERLPGPVDASTLTADFPHSPTADEYRRVLARIIYPPDDTVEVNSCLIASPTKGDGRTAAACNLAISLAQANRHVLLMDVCARNPGVERSFKLEPTRGLSEVLFGEADFHGVVRETDYPGLYVIGPGFHGDGLHGKLASREMMDLLEQVEKEFDHVIIDTPPSLLMSDAKLLAPIVDAVVVVVGTGTSTMGMVRRCLAELDQVNANLIGTILNRIRPTRGGYLRRNLELFYKYNEVTQRKDGFDGIPEMKIQEEGAGAGPSLLVASESRHDEAGPGDPPMSRSR